MNLTHLATTKNQHSFTKYSQTIKNYFDKQVKIVHIEKVHAKESKKGYAANNALPKVRAGH